MVLNPADFLILSKHTHHLLQILASTGIHQKKSIYGSSGFFPCVSSTKEAHCTTSKIDGSNIKSMVIQANSIKAWQGRLEEIKVKPWDAGGRQWVCSKEPST